jgi:hypothetical protein
MGAATRAVCGAPSVRSRKRLEEECEQAEGAGECKPKGVCHARPPGPGRVCAGTRSQTGRGLCVWGGGAVGQRDTHAHAQRLCGCAQTPAGRRWREGGEKVGPCERGFGARAPSPCTTSPRSREVNELEMRRW